MSFRNLFLMISLILTAGCSKTDEWEPVFNGVNLSEWEHVGPGRVYVEDGLMKTEGGMGLLWYTKEKFGNCTIRVVFRTTAPDDNSGIFIRIPDPPKDPWQAVHTGNEVQILEQWPESYEKSEHQEEYGLEWHMTGAIYSMSKATKQNQLQTGEWNTLEIELKGQRTLIYLNGEKVNDFDPNRDEIPPRQHDYEPIRGPRPDFGYIGIQNHHEPQTVHYKEISVLRH